MITRSQIALNAIQWINIKADPNDPNSDDLWLYAEPSFRAQYPGVLAKIKTAGFDAVMMEVLGTQTLQNYRSMLADAGLRPAPGYCQIGLPEDHGLSLATGSAEWVHWFDGVRRKAEESNFFGLTSVFLAPEVDSLGQGRMTGLSAIGDRFDADRLSRVTETLHEAASILTSEGLRAGLHNHVGSWVETEHEIDTVLGAIDDDLLGASFDLGHLEWAGIDSATMIAKYRDRIVDLHLKDLDTGVAADSRANPTSYSVTTDRGIFREPGLGDLDLDGALRALPDDFGGWIIIEVDRASMNPDDSVHVSWDWVKTTFPT